MDKLIPYFPDITENTNIQKTLHIMEEFLSVESKKEKEIIREKGDLLRHQIQGARISMLTNRILNVHKPGSGKTCLQNAIIMLLMDNARIYKKFHIYTLKSLTQETKKQFLCKCTDGFYFETDKKTGESVIGKNFKTKIEIAKHIDLFHKILLDKTHNIGKTVAQLDKEFGNTVVFIDEISKIIRNKAVSKKINDDGDVVYSVIGELLQLEKIKTVEDLDRPEIRNSKSKYIQFWRLAQAVPTMKFIGLTGTPLANHPPEFFLLANCFLPLDKQFDVIKFSNDLFNLTIHDYKRLNGYISYIGSSSNVSREIFNGYIFDHYYKYPGLKKPIKSKLKLFYRELYHVQAEFMINEGLSFSSNSISLLPQCFVGLDMNIKDDVLFDSKLKEDEDENEILDIDFSCGDFSKTNLENPITRMQTASIINEIVQNEYDMFLEGNEGTCYIYNTLTTTVYKPYQKIFKSYGFEVITNEDIKIEDVKTTNYCEIGNSIISGIFKYSDKPRVVFLDSKVNDSVREKILSIFSSEENVNGKIIQVLMGSSIFNMGVNIGNVNRFFRIGPEWAKSSEEQSKFRVLRETSNIYTKKYLAEKHGVPISEIDASIDFYYFCAYIRSFYFEVDDAIMDDENDFERIMKTVNKNNKMNNIILMNGVKHYRLDSRNINYGVGFVKKGVIDEIDFGDGSIEMLPFFKICNEEDDPFEILEVFFSDNGHEISRDYNSFLLDDDYQLIYLQYGLFQIINCGEDDEGSIFDKITDGTGAMIFKREGSNNLNVKELLKPTTSNSYEIASEDYIMFANEFEIPLKLQIISSAYNQYLMMEEKSFPEKNVIRKIQQIAFDCIANEKRNRMPNTDDYTEKCEYDICDYKCYSQIIDQEKKEKQEKNERKMLEDGLNSLTIENGNVESEEDSENEEENIDDFIMGDQETFYDNMNILYSDLDITQCKNMIIGFVKESGKMLIDAIYQEMIDNYQYREYIINKSIISILTSKESVKDRFGYPCYFCSNNKYIFLRRGFSNMTVDEKQFPDITSLIGVTSEQSFTRNYTIDDKKIEAILNIDPSISRDNPKLENLFHELNDKLTLYESKRILLEKSYINRIFTSIYVERYPIIREKYPKLIEEFKVNPINILITDKEIINTCKMTDELFKTLRDEIRQEKNAELKKQKKALEEGKRSTKQKQKNNFEVSSDIMYEEEISPDPNRIPKYFIIFPDEKSAFSSKGIVSKMADFKDFKIFDMDENYRPFWRKPTTEEKIKYLDVLIRKKTQAVKNKVTGTNLKIWTIENGKSVQIKTKYYVTVSGDSYKFVHPTSRVSPGISKESVKIETLNKAFQYLKEVVDVSKYNEAELNEAFSNYIKYEKSKKDTRSNALIEICKILDIINTIN